MSTASVSIVGLGLNVADRLPNVLSQIESLASSFKYTQFVYVNGKSTDDSEEIFRKWQSSPRLNSKLDYATITTPIGVPENDNTDLFRHKVLPREGRLAYSRNHGIAQLQSLPKTDYIIVMDLDIRGWDENGIATTFSHDNWDVMCSRGVNLYGIYRDTYAVRSKTLHTNHHTAGQDFYKYNLTVEDMHANIAKLHESKQRIARFGQGSYVGDDLLDKKSGEADLITVDSCFGGLAVYKANLFEQCEYLYREETFPHMLDCEHVHLHRCMKEKYKANIYINPKM
jgi:glycosyltransferase involved in cell wall biosynthesis